MSRSLLQAALAFLGLVLAGCAAAQGSSPNPAATVNGHAISMAAYNTQVSYMRNQTYMGIDQDVCQVKGLAALCHKLKQTALQTLIYEEIVRQYARTHHISVSPSELNSQWTLVMQTKFQGNEAVVRAYARHIGITEAAYKAMIGQDMLQQRVMYDLTKHMPTTAPAVRLAEIAVADNRHLQAVRAALRRSEAFNTIAANLSQATQGPCAQAHCGEVGWVPLALLPATERRLMSAPAGRVVGPVAGQQALALFLIEGHQPSYPLTAKQQLSMRQQTFTRWVQQQAQRASVHRYVAT